MPTLRVCAKELVSDALWNGAAPLLPPHPPRPCDGRPPRDDRDCLHGIIFVLRTDFSWEWRLREVFGVSGVTCLRRLRDWAQAGVQESRQQALLDELGEKGRIDWSRAAVDYFSVPAKKGDPTGPNPTDLVRRAPSAIWRWVARGSSR